MDYIGNVDMSWAILLPGFSNTGRQKGVDLIVIGHRGLGPGGGLLGGVVARKLVNMISISCLVATE